MDEKDFLIKFKQHVRKMLDSNKITKEKIIENLKNNDCPFLFDDLILDFLYLSKKGTIRRSHMIEENMDLDFKKCCEFLKQNKNIRLGMLNIVQKIVEK